MIGLTVGISSYKSLHCKFLIGTNDFRHIVTFKDACEVLGIRYNFSYMDRLNRTLSISTSAMFRLNIVRRALVKNYVSQEALLFIILLIHL